MTSKILGVAAVVFVRFVCGLDWIPSLFLYFPFHALARSIAENDGEGLVGNALLIVVYPILLMGVALVTNLAVDRALAAGISVDKIGLTFVSAAVTAVLFFAAQAIVFFIARSFGAFALPAAVHVLVFRVLSIFAYTLALAAVVGLVRHLDARFGSAGIPKMLKLVFAAAAGLVFVAAIRRLFTAEAVPVAAGRARSRPGKAAAAQVKLATRPNVRLADVMGMEAAKEQIRLRLIEPVRNAAQARLYGLKVGGGVLLYGPPGTGKTLLARAVAGELGVPFYMVTAADVFGKYVGESEGNMRRLFAEIRRNKLSVVFIDELETLFPSRTADVHETTRKVISVLLQELDGLDQNKNPILLLGATNVPWMVDEAFLRPGRFDVKVFVGLPDEAARRGILKAAFEKGGIPRESRLEDYMAAQTRNYSGADLGGVMDRLRQLAYAQRARYYSRALADAAIASVSPTATGAILDQIRDWEAVALPENSGNAGGSGVKLAVRPDVRLDDVMGMEDVKEQIRLRLIDPVSDQTVARRYGLKIGGGMLLYGPPGTGKTFLARAVAGELQLPFFSVTVADIFGKYVGESERNVRKLFRDIRKNDLSVVFIDELETIFPKRTADVHETTRKVISLLLQELDGLDQTKNPILLMGATNVPWLVDEAFLRPGRFDICLFVGLPDAAARRAMLARALDTGEVPHERGLADYIAARTENYSGADLKGLVERLRQAAFRQRLACYTRTVADEVLAASRPSVNVAQLEQLKRWELSRSPASAAGARAGMEI